MKECIPSSVLCKVTSFYRRRGEDVKTIVKVPYMLCIVIIPYVWLWGIGLTGYNA